MSDPTIVKKTCWFCKDGDVPLGICQDCRDRTCQIVDRQDPGVLGDWAMVLEQAYSISGHGISLSGQLLYGQPRKGHRVRVGSGKEAIYGNVKGIEHYTVSSWWWPGAEIAILLEDKVITSGRTVDTEKGLFKLPGLVILGSQNR